jgi:preprotein translocase subunit SecG
MQNFLLVIHVLLSMSLIALILLQQGKGADAGAAFGSGASGTVFGSKGSASFLSRATAILATLFFTVSLALAIAAHRQADYETDVDKYALPAASEEAAAEQMIESDSDVPVVPTSEGSMVEETMAGDAPEAPVVNEMPVVTEEMPAAADPANP